MYDHSVANEKMEKSDQNNSNDPTSTQSCLESMENKLGSSGIVSPGFTPIEILRKIQKDLEARQIDPEQLGRIILFMSLFSDIDWTRKEILWSVFRIPKE